MFNLEYICNYELSFRLLSFLCYVIFDIDHLTSSPQSVLLLARMRDSLFFCNAFPFCILRLLSNWFWSYICILLVGNTSLGLFWTSPVRLLAQLTSSHRCHLPASQTRLFGYWFWHVLWKAPTSVVMIRVPTSIEWSRWPHVFMTYLFDAMKLWLVGLSIVNM